MTETTQLKRSISLPLLVFYGVGTMVGGGFYALVGKVAGHAGMAAPLSMLVASLLALCSALSFAELCARYPFSAGESVYIEKAFRLPPLSILVGWMVITTGVVSAATLANAIVEFLQDQLHLQREIGIFGAVAFLGLVAAWGIGESVALAVVITVIEVTGLLYVIALSGQHFGDIPARIDELLPAMTTEAWSGIALGGFLVFYAFLGFEDMVNMAEEVKRPRRNLPRAIYWTLATTTLLYFFVALGAVLTLTPEQLSTSKNALADVAAANGSDLRPVMGVVAVLAGVNGALVQVIMAARVAYGMSDKGLGPRWLARVHPRTRTPLRATLLASILVLVLAMWFPLQTLAQITSTIILMVFAVVNLALWRIKGRDPAPPEEGPCFPRWVPIIGFLASVGFLGFRLAQEIG